MSAAANGHGLPEEIETVASDLQHHREEQAGRDVGYRDRFDSLDLAVAKVGAKVDMLAAQIQSLLARP